MNRRLFSLLHNLAWAVVIFLLCAAPPSALPRASISHADKLAHFGLFFVMSFLLLDTLGAWTRLGAARSIVVVVLCCTAYGGVIEMLQANYLHRGGEWMDLLADGAGAIAGSLAYFALKRRKK
jgi:VanZ family protein